MLRHLISANQQQRLQRAQPKARIQYKCAKQWPLIISPNTSSYFYYIQIILIVSLTSMRNSTKRESTQAEQDKLNYKEMYLQCKKNVAVFMKHVDNEMASILRKHDAEKKRLEEEIERLKVELKEQNQGSTFNNSRTSSHQNAKRNNSESKVFTQSSVSKETVEECLAKFSRLDLRPRETPERRNQGDLSARQERRSILKSINQEEKENQTPYSNIREDMSLGEMKFLSTAPRRDQRLKEKKLPNGNEKVESIKDFLKDIRGKLNSREKSGLKEKEEPIVHIISPDMFTNHRSEIC